MSVAWTSEPAEPIAPAAYTFLDQGSGVLDGRDGLSVQPCHDLIVAEEVVESLEILRCPRTKTQPVRIEAQQLSGVVTSHPQTLLRPPGPVFGSDPRGSARTDKSDPDSLLLTSHEP